MATRCIVFHVEPRRVKESHCEAAFPISSLRGRRKAVVAISTESVIARPRSGRGNLTKKQL